MKITLMSCPVIEPDKLAYQIQQNKTKQNMKTSLVKDSVLLNELLECVIN